MTLRHHVDVKTSSSLPYMANVIYKLKAFVYLIKIVHNNLTTQTNKYQQILATLKCAAQRRRGPVVGHSLWTRPARVQSPWEARIIRCKNLALYIRDCESLCLSDETVKAVGPFYLVSMPGEAVKYPTQGVNM